MDGSFRSRHVGGSRCTGAATTGWRGSAPPGRRRSQRDGGQGRAGLDDVAALARQVAAQRQQQRVERRPRAGPASRRRSTLRCRRRPGSRRSVRRRPRPRRQHRHREHLAPRVADAHEPGRDEGPQLVAAAREDRERAPAASTTDAATYPLPLADLLAPPGPQRRQQKRRPTKQTKRIVAAPVLSKRSSAT